MVSPNSELNNRRILLGSPLAGVNTDRPSPGRLQVGYQPRISSAEFTFWRGG